MATDDARSADKPSPVKFDAATYADLKIVARVQGKDISRLAAELVRAPLALLKSKLGPEIAQLRKSDEALEQLAAKARKKVSGEASGPE